MADLTPADFERARKYASREQPNGFNDADANLARCFLALAEQNEGLTDLAAGAVTKGVFAEARAAELSEQNEKMRAALHPGPMPENVAHYIARREDGTWFSGAPFYSGFPEGYPWCDRANAYESITGLRVDGGEK